MRARRGELCLDPSAAAAPTDGDTHRFSDRYNRLLDGRAVKEGAYFAAPVDHGSDVRHAERHDVLRLDDGQCEAFRHANLRRSAPQ